MRLKAGSVPSIYAERLIPVLADTVRNQHNRYRRSTTYRADRNGRGISGHAGSGTIHYEPTPAIGQSQCPVDRKVYPLTRRVGQYGRQLLLNVDVVVGSNLPDAEAEDAT